MKIKNWKDLKFEKELRKWNRQAIINKGSNLSVKELAENRKYFKSIY